MKHQTIRDWVKLSAAFSLSCKSSSISWLPTGKRIKYYFYLISSRYDFLTSVMIFWIFVDIFRVLFFYFLYSLEIILIPIIQTNFGKISSRFSFSLEDFLYYLLYDIIVRHFPLSVKLSQKKLVRKIFTVHTFSVAEKVARSFTASFRGSIYFSSRSLLLLFSRLRNPPETHHQN